MTTRVPDPGSPHAARLALLLSLVLFAAVAGLQMLGGRAALAEPEAEGYAMPDPESGSLLLESRIAIGLHALLGPGARDSIGSPAGSEVEDPPTAENVRVAAILAYLDGADAATEHLDAVRVAAAPHEDRAFLADDAALFQRVIKGETLNDADRSALEAAHGWFGRLALAFPTPEGSPEREAVERPARRLVVFILAAVVCVGLAFLVGIAFFIVFAVRLSGRRLSRGFVRPAPGGSVYLEMFAAFLAAFLLLQLVVGGVLGAMFPGSDALWWIGMSAQWLLVGVIGYPLLRRVPLHQVCADLGLNRGKGVMREVGAGIVGYLAGLPLLVAGFGLVLLLQWLIVRAGGEKPTPHNPVVDATTGGNVAAMVMVIVLATIWAPLVEETIFRGALFRHARSRLPVVPAAILVGFFFAFMHSYGPIFTPPLIALGTTFALLREWRGSLIAPMTAHALHNGSLMVLIVFVSTAGGT